jgi:hypothetical protein
MLVPYVHRLVMRLTKCVVRRSPERSGRWPTDFRPHLEVLEDRTLPAQVFWTNAAGGDWDTASNWSTGATPGSADDVIIDVPSGVTVTHSQNIADTVQSLVSQANLAVSFGSLTVTSDTTDAADLTLSGGTLASGGTWTVSGMLNWTAGTISGAGRLRAAGGLNIAGSTPKILDGGTLDNARSALWTGGTLLASNGAAINNLTGATFELQGDLNLTNLAIGDDPSFTNTGTFLKSSGSGTTTFNGIAFNNNGSLVEQSGTLNLGAGGTGTGQWVARAGGSLDFSGGTFSFQPGSSVAGGFSGGPGSVRFSGGTSNVAGNFQVVDLSLTGGTLNFLVAPTLYDVSISGGTLTGPATVTVNRTMTWTGGAITGGGRIVLNGDMTVAGSADKTLTDRTLDNTHTVAWTGNGNILFSGLCTWNNLAGGVLDIQADGSFASVIGSGEQAVFNNAGTVRKSAGTGTTAMPGRMQFDSSGTVDVQSGTLAIQGPGVGSGQFTAGINGTLEFGDYSADWGSYQLAATSSVTGAGNVTFAGRGPSIGGAYAITGQTSVSAFSVDFLHDASMTTLTIASISSTGEVIGGRGDLTVSGLLTWSGGTIGGTGRLLALGGILLTSSANKVLARNLENAATATWAGGNLFFGFDVTWTNQAGSTFDAQTNGLFGTNSATFVNAGRFLRSSGTGSVTVYGQFNNTGSVEVRSGTLEMQGSENDSGSFQVSGGATLSFGGNPSFAPTYTLTASSSISGAGTVSFRAGFFPQVANILGSFSVGTTQLIGGVANFFGTATTDSLTMTSGTLGGSGTVTVAGQLAWSGGVMTGPGRTVASGGLTLSGTNAKQLTAGRTLDNAATAIWTGGAVSLDHSTLNNLAGATFDCQTEANLGTDTGVVTNAGIFRRSSSGVVVALGTFNNSGSVVVQAGVLELQADGNASGSFQVSAGAMLSFGGSSSRSVTYDLSSTSSITGAGTVSFQPTTGGTTNIFGSYSAATTLVGGLASLNFFGTATTTTLTMQSGALGGSATFTVAGQLTWSGGTMVGPGRTVASGGLMLSGNSTKQLSAGRSLDNAATAVWTGGIFDLESDGVLNNQAGATLDIQTDAPVFGYGTINNAGTLEKTASSAGTTVFDGVAQLINDGTLSVLSGTIELRGGDLTSSGVVNVGLGATLFFSGGTHTFTPSSRVMGQGTIDCNAQEVDIDGSYALTGLTRIGTGVKFLTDVTLGSLTLNSGALIGPGNVTVTGTLNWTAGTMSGGGRTIANGFLNITSNGAHSIEGRTLDIAAGGTITSPFFGGGVVNNLAGSVLVVQLDGFFSNMGFAMLNNFGTLRKLGTSMLSLSGNVANSGLIDVQAGGITLGNGTHTGQFTVAAATTLGFYRSQNNFTAASSVSGPGTVEFEIGSVTNISGSFAPGVTQFTGGIANFFANTALADLGVSDGNLAAWGNVTVNGTFTWTGGTLSGMGQILTRGTSSVSGPGTKVLDGAALVNAGTASWTDAGNIVASNGPAFTNQAGAVFNASNDAQLQWNGIGATAIFSNAGTFVKSAGTGVSMLTVSFRNTGLLEVTTGTVFVAGSFSNFNATAKSLTGGSYSVIGTLKFIGADIHSSAATLTLDGASARIVNQANADALASFSTNTAAGTFTIQNGAAFTAIGEFTNRGQVYIGNTSTFTTAGGYTQSAGLTGLGGGTLAVGAGNQVSIGQGSTLAGTGTINGDVLNAGLLAIGTDPAFGTLTINGAYAQAQSGNLQVTLGGTTAGTEYDVLVVNGLVTLDGTLTISLASGYTPVAGDSFQVLIFAARSGDFATENGLDLGGGLQLSPSYDDTSLTLTAVPSP